MSSGPSGLVLPLSAISGGRDREVAVGDHLRFSPPADVNGLWPHGCYHIDPASRLDEPRLLIMSDEGNEKKNEPARYMMLDYGQLTER